MVCPFAELGKVPRALQAVARATAGDGDGGDSVSLVRLFLDIGAAYAAYGRSTHHLESRVSSGLAHLNNLTAAFVALPKTVSSLTRVNCCTVIPK